MNIGHSLLKAFSTIGLVLTLGTSMNADAGILGFGGTSWKEEVLLHDGSKIIVKRSQSYGGRHEIGQSGTIKEHSITFTLPGSSKSTTWTSEFGEDVGRTYFDLLALHVLNGTPYIVTEPNLCLSYNKWGRPNPPYVFFRHDEKAWQRIPLTEFPSEFKTINLIVNTGREAEIETLASKRGHVSAEDVRGINSSLMYNYPQYRSILREPMPNLERNCPEMIRTGDGGWTGLGPFMRQTSLEACLKYCEREKVAAQSCPCKKLFEGK